MMKALSAILGSLALIYVGYVAGQRIWTATPVTPEVVAHNPEAPPDGTPGPVDPAALATIPPLDPPALEVSGAPAETPVRPPGEVAVLRPDRQAVAEGTSEPPAALPAPVLERRAVDERDFDVPVEVLHRRAENAATLILDAIGAARAAR